MNTFRFCVCMHEKNDGGYFFTVQPHRTIGQGNGCTTYYIPVRGYVTQHKTAAAAHKQADRFNRGTATPTRWPYGGLLDENGEPKPYILRSE